MPDNSHSSNDMLNETTQQLHRLADAYDAQAGKMQATAQEMRALARQINPKPAPVIERPKIDPNAAALEWARKSGLGAHGGGNQ